MNGRATTGAVPRPSRRAVVLAIVLALLVCGCGAEGDPPPPPCVQGDYNPPGASMTVPAGGFGMSPSINFWCDKGSVNYAISAAESDRFDAIMILAEYALSYTGRDSLPGYAATKDDVSSAHASARVPGDSYVAAIDCLNAADPCNLVVTLSIGP
jgi:hypothetical protein